MMRWTFRLFCIAMILGAIGVAYPSVNPKTHAQGIAAIRYGENKIGEVKNQNEYVLFSFSVEEGTTLIEVWGAGFQPVVELRDASREEILVANPNDEESFKVELHYDNFGEERYRAAGYIAVTGLYGRIGQFAVSLTKIEPAEASAGITVSVGPELRDTFDEGEESPGVFNFSALAEGTLYVDVRSYTGDFHPQVTLYDGFGQPLGRTDNNTIYGVRYLLPSGEATYQLIVERGDFTGVAEYTVTLENGPAVGDDGTIGFPDPPEAGCYVTTDSPVNIRSGGSPDHEVVGVLGANKYLIVNGYNGANDLWYSVIFPDGQTGWIASFVVTAEGSCDNLPLRSFNEPASE